MSTSNRCQFDVFCPLINQLFMFPPVGIRLQLFESQRRKNLVELALKSSENVTVNQPVIHGTGQT